MAISRRKITTTTTTEELYDENSHSDDASTVLDSRQHELPDHIRNMNETGATDISNPIAQTSPKEPNEFENKIGKTWGDVFYAIFITNNAWANRIVVLLVYGFVFYIFVTNYNKCNLLNPSSWIWLLTPLIVATAIIAIYFIILWLIKKLSKNLRW